jgi:hypothetical protein
MGLIKRMGNIKDAYTVPGGSPEGKNHFVDLGVMAG